MRSIMLGEPPKAPEETRLKSKSPIKIKEDSESEKKDILDDFDSLL